MGKKKEKQYDQGALQYLAQAMEDITRPRKNSNSGVNANSNGSKPFNQNLKIWALPNGNGVLGMKVNLEGLKNAIESLPKKEKVAFQKFWGLLGGQNFRKIMEAGTCKKNKTIELMCNEAEMPLKRLFKLDFAKMYDENLDAKIQQLAKKINKRGAENVSDLECVKYLMVYMIFLKNGPKFYDESELSKVNTAVDEMGYLDEYKSLNEMCEILNEFSDHSICIRLIIDLIQMMDVKDSETVLQNFGIKTPDMIFSSDEIEEFESLAAIRAIKEKMFKYGAWDVICRIISGNPVKLDDVMKELDELRKDWSKLECFKQKQRKLETSSGIKAVDVYTIGGLDFTDEYEIRFLYLEANFIASII